MRDEGNARRRWAFFSSLIVLLGSVIDAPGGLWGELYSLNISRAVTTLMI
jgi:hypothetical protein